MNINLYFVRLLSTETGAQKHYQACQTCKVIDGRVVDQMGHFTRAPGPAAPFS